MAYFTIYFHLFINSIALKDIFMIKNYKTKFFIVDKFPIVFMEVYDPSENYLIVAITLIK